MRGTLLFCSRKAAAAQRLRRQTRPAFSIRSRMPPTVAGSMRQLAAMVFWSAAPAVRRKSNTLGWPALRPSPAARAITQRDIPAWQRIKR